MQQVAEAQKDQLWDRLKVHYDKYADENGQVSIPTVEEFIVDVLGEEEQADRDYVMKNLFRLDVDGSGTVSFVELGNFLFKRHCGQMSLQKQHKKGKMSHGSQRKMNLPEFIDLMDRAYSFLKLQLPKDLGEFIFNDVDKDEDKLITYVEYFKVIEKYVCRNPNYKVPKSEEKPKEVAPQGKERHSKLRRHIWENLRRLYDAYVQGRCLSATDAEFRALIFAIMGELSEAELTFMSSGLLQLNFKTIDFQTFALHFIYLAAELGLSRFAKNNPSVKKTLNKDQFVRLLRNSFWFLRLDTFKVSILYKIFAKIDKNQDGLITYDEYLDWVKRFLCVWQYFGDEFYVEEDDEDLDPSDPYEKPPEPVKPKTSGVQFVFSDYTFAKQVRARVYELLVPYDADKNEEFSKEEIEAALVGLLKEDPKQLQYVTKNVFRYDRDNNNQVTYDQLTNFCVEQHFGEMAIQRLHRKGFYSKGAERIMNEEEFGKTLNQALDYINMVAPPEIISLLFKEIDLDHDGWITYVIYFLFLKYYFGSASLARIDTIKDNKPVQLSADQKFLLELKDLSPWDRFVRILIDQLRTIFFLYDYNKNQIFEYDEISDILSKVFELDSNEVDYFMFNYFNFEARKEGAVTFQELIAIVLSIYFIEILFKRRYKSNNNDVWKNCRISLEEFITLIIEACFFIRIKPLREDLVWIFNELDTDKDGYITFQQYVDFIKKYLGNNIDFIAKKEKPANPDGISDEQLGFVKAIWDQLKVYFDKYDKGAKTFLREDELKAFVIEVLHETSQRELDYVFWNLFRVDSNSNKEVDFEQFAPFILNHAGEIALQRFHREQEKGKSTLSQDELYIVLNNAYSFLVSVPKEKKAIYSIHERIQKNGAVSYALYLNWIHRALAARYKK